MSTLGIFAACWMAMGSASVVWLVVQAKMEVLHLGDHHRFDADEWFIYTVVAALGWPLAIPMLIADALQFRKEMKELEDRRLPVNAGRSRSHAPKGPCGCRACR